MPLGTFLKAMYEEHHTGRERLGTSIYEKIRGPLFAAWIGSGKRVLDVGCRDGTLTKWFWRGNIVCGIDIDESALTLCRKSLGISGTLGNINESLPFQSGSFDIVVLGEVIEHTFFPSAILTEVHRVLKPGGLMLGSVPNGYHILKRWSFLRGDPPEHDPTHFHTFSLTSLQQLLESKFTVEEILPLGGRYRRVFPSLFCHDFIWRCWKK